MLKPVTIDDLVKLGYTPDESAVDCIVLPTGTSINVQGQDSSRGVRLADFIADISQQIPKSVEFHGDSEQINSALEADLHLYRAKRLKLAAAINVAFFTGFAALAYSFQNIICYSSIILFGPLPVLYALTESNRETITRYFFKKH